MSTMAALWSFVLVVGLLTLTPGLDTALILRTATVQSARSAWGVVLGIQTGTLAWGILASAGITALLTASQLAYDVVRWTGAAYLIWMGARMLWSTRRRATSAPARIAPHETTSTPLHGASGTTITPADPAPGKDPGPATPWELRRSAEGTSATSPEPTPGRHEGPATPWEPTRGGHGTYATSPGKHSGSAAPGRPALGGQGTSASDEAAPVDGQRDSFVAGWRRGLFTNLLNPKMGAFYVALLPQFIPAGKSPLLYGVLLAGVHVALGLAWSTVLVTAARRLRALLRRPRARRILDRVTGVVIVGFGLRLATEAR